jgi:hypothetical protein
MKRLNNINMTKESEIATALGYMLATYHNNLTYFSNFIKFANGEITIQKWSIKEFGSFKNFLDEYAVSRNTDTNRIHDLLQATKEWHDRGDYHDIDRLSASLKERGLTHHFLAISLSSKIMMLMRPEQILPFDKLAKLGLKLKFKDSSYSEFQQHVHSFARSYSADIDKALNSVTHLIQPIEAEFGGKLENLAQIRRNRFIDKWLWVRGKNSVKGKSVVPSLP